MELEAAQPRCLSCGTVMADHPRGFRCAACGYLDDRSAELEAVVIPEEFDGDDINAWMLRRDS